MLKSLKGTGLVRACVRTVAAAAIMGGWVSAHGAIAITLLTDVLNGLNTLTVAREPGGAGQILFREPPANTPLDSIQIRFSNELVLSPRVSLSDWEFQLEPDDIDPVGGTLGIYYFGGTDSSAGGEYWSLDTPVTLTFQLMAVEAGAWSGNADLQVGVAAFVPPPHGPAVATASATLQEAIVIPEPAAGGAILAGLLGILAGTRMLTRHRAGARLRRMDDRHPAQHGRGDDPISPAISNHPVPKPLSVNIGIPRSPGDLSPGGAGASPENRLDTPPFNT